MRANRGFTLVEILIVVVILGILAAIVIPQFTEASTEAKESRLASDLQMLRSQIELYKIQHSDAPPALADLTNGGAMTTAVNGFGPYMQQIPTNPFNNSNAVVANGAGGWVYTAATGVIHPGPDATADTAAHQAL